jgi:hypothetical protein
MSSGSVRLGFSCTFAGIWNLSLGSSKKSHESATKCQLLRDSHVATGTKSGQRIEPDVNDLNFISEHSNDQRRNFVRAAVNERSGQWADGTKMASENGA